IRVVVRIRPPLPTEKAQTCTNLTVDSGSRSVRLAHPKQQEVPKAFQFDRVFDAQTTQQQIFDETGISATIQSVMDGFNATIFAYGQTGSGKTFSMEGYEYEKNLSRPSERVQAKPKVDVSSDRLGMVPRVILGLYKAVAATEKAREYTVKCSFVQIYNEQILDLLNPSLSATSKSLRLRWASNEEFYVENLIINECSNADEMLGKFQDGVKQKIMASHNLNAASSRSHCIYTLYVESVDPASPQDVTKAKLSLVDLAGSERVVKTGATGVTLQESIGINKSLFVLRQVIQTLSDQAAGTSEAKAHVPYRDSKLTALLKHSLGGNSITLMIACLSPSDVYFDENLSTLQYAAKAQSIANKPVKNEDPKTALIQQLREEVAQLKVQLAQAHEVILQLGGKEMTGSNNDDTRVESPAPLPGVSPPPLIAAESTPKTPPAKTPAKTPAKKPASSATPESNQDKEPEATPLKELPGAKKLKLNVIDNVSMIKAMYQNEKQLRQELEATKVQAQKWSVELRTLNIENRSLRERMEVLEYLALSGDPTNDTLALVRPSQDCIDQVLQSCAKPQHTGAPKRGPTLEERDHQTSAVDATPKPTHETGVLSVVSLSSMQILTQLISELRHLLSGKSQ
ncbi:Kinesin motor domain containing protein, partial [Achlya hypogyna]